MNYEFMQQVAPMLAIPPDEGDSQDSWITPEQGNDQPLYGADGMPLNYIRDQGGPTQYYSPNGTSNITADSGQIRATARSAPTPIQGLRGLTPDAPLNPAFNIRGRQSAAPQVAPPSNLLTPGMTPQTIVPNFGQRPIVQIPPSEEAPVESYIDGAGLQSPQDRRPLPNLPGIVRHGPPMTDQQLDDQRMERIRRSDSRYMGTSEVLDIPPNNRREAPEYNPHSNLDRYDQMIQQSGQNNGANTLFDMFDQAGFRPPQFLLDLVGRGQNGPGSTMGRMVGAMGPAGDLRGPTADVQRTSSTHGGIPEFSTDQGLAEFNYRMFGDNTDRYLTSQLRTQAQQDDWYNRGLTTTRHSAHITGRAYDYPASRLSGRRGREAIIEVQRQMRAAGYDINQLEFRWESGQGRGQGTGPHVHVEPK